MNSKNNIAKSHLLVLKTYTKLMRCTESVTAKMHKHLAAHKLTVSQFAVLEALYNLGPLSQKDIGRKILKTSGNITLVIDNLEKHGLVRRHKNENDRRSITVKLTDDGCRLIDKLFPAHAEVAAKVCAVLSTEELEELGRLLKVLGLAAAGHALTDSLR